MKIFSSWVFIYIAFNLWMLKMSVCHIRPVARAQKAPESVSHFKGAIYQLLWPWQVLFVYTQHGPEDFWSFCHHRTYIQNSTSQVSFTFLPFVQKCVWGTGGAGDIVSSQFIQGESSKTGHFSLLKGKLIIFSQIIYKLLTKNLLFFV